MQCDIIIFSEENEFLDEKEDVEKCFKNEKLGMRTYLYSRNVFLRSCRECSINSFEHRKHF